MSDWTQPLCARCWARAHPGRMPHRLIATELERCCQCAVPTNDGIYVRADPAGVPFPRIEP